MANFDDFDLDIKEIRNRGRDIIPNATLGVICTGISSAIISSWAQGCSDQCKTQQCTEGAICSGGCPKPSIDYEHRSCRGPLNDGTIQINC